jgi:hypothetical protein
MKRVGGKNLRSREGRIEDAAPALDAHQATMVVKEASPSNFVNSFAGMGCRK